MTNQTAIIDSIAKHLVVTPADIDLTSSLADDLGLGPIEISDLLSELAEEYKISFSQEDVSQIKTVNDLVLAVEDLSLE